MKTNKNNEKQIFRKCKEHSSVYETCNPVQSSAIQTIHIVRLCSAEGSSTFHVDQFLLIKNSRMLC